MLQDSSQNDTSLPDKLRIWLEWLAINTTYVQSETAKAGAMQRADTEIPDSMIEILHCIISIPRLLDPSATRHKKLKVCLEKIHDNQNDIAVFFKALEKKPSLLIEVLQKLGRPMPLPLKDLLCAIEEVADDISSASADLREAIIIYLELMKYQQLQIVSLMQASLEAVSEREIADGRNSVKSFVDEWVQEFETEFVLAARRDKYAKGFGQLINASIQILKKQKLYREQMGASPEVP